MNATANDLYESARRRVEATPELSAHSETILYDWAEGDAHWQWVLTAPVSQIVEWAGNVEAGSRE